MSIRDYAVVWQEHNGGYVSVVYRFLGPNAVSRHVTKSYRRWTDAIRAGEKWAACHKPKKRVHL